MDNQTLDLVNRMVSYTPLEVVANLALAVVLGVIIALIYRATHKGLAYSQSFTLTIVLVAVIVAMVMMVIGSSLARAFALVGALSIIRFRTVVKDTKDTAFVFAGLAVGLAAGTSNYFLAVVGTVVISALALILHKINFGALYKSEFILRFNFDQNYNSAAYLERIKEFAKRSSMLHMEAAGDGRYLKMTYDVVLKEGVQTSDLISAMAGVQGASDVILIASKNDVDY